MSKPVTKPIPLCPLAGFQPCRGSDCILWSWSIVQIKAAEVHYGSCGMAARSAGAESFEDPSGGRSRDYYTEVEHQLRMYGNREKNNDGPAPKTAKPKAVVYFIESTRAKIRGPIKIGVSKNPKARRSALQSSNAETLILLATEPGGFEREGELHNSLKKHRITGEWFHPHADVLAAIASATPWK